MATNVKIQLLRGLLANLPPTTGAPGVLAWTTDSNELFIDTGTAFQRLAAGNQVFNVANPAALTGLTAMIGDFAVSASDGTTYILTAFPASTSGNWKAIATQETGPGVDVTPLPGATSHEWVTYIDSSGVQHLAQPNFSDIAGQLSQTQLPTTIGAGSALTSIDCGTF